MKTLVRNSSGSLLVVAAVLLMNGCGDSGAPDSASTQQVSQVKPPVNQRAGTVKSPSKAQANATVKGTRLKIRKPIRLRFVARVGEKSVGEEQTTRNDSTGTPVKVRARTTFEVESVENGRTRWKTTSDELLEEMGQHKFPTGSGLSKNRIVFMEFDRFGNLINAEGQDPDTQLTFGTFPERPVKVGETWKGFTRFRGRKYEGVNRLEYVDLIQGRQYAVIASEVTVQGLEKTKMWIDLTNGRIVRIERNGASQDSEGEPYQYSSTFNLLKPNGKPVLS